MNLNFFSQRPAPSQLVSQRLLHHRLGALFICVGLSITGIALSGCGNTLYLVQVSQAEEAFEEAKELGAEKVAPYEFYGAEARLKEAREQAAHAEYGNAAKLSDEATALANRAVLLTKNSRLKANSTPPNSTPRNENQP